MVAGYDFKPGSVLAQVSASMSTIEAAGHLPTALMLGQQEWQRLEREVVGMPPGIVDPHPAGWTVFGMPMFCVEQVSILVVVAA